MSRARLLEYGQLNVIFDDCMADCLLLWKLDVVFYLSQKVGVGLKTLISNKGQILVVIRACIRWHRFDVPIPPS